MKAVEVIHAFGHKNVQASHKTTFEVTKENHLSKKGDCIIAVGADKGLREFSEDFKALMRREKAVLTILIEAGGISDAVKAHGSPALSFADPTDMVIRKSNYVCDRTLAVKSNKAACDLSRHLVDMLKIPGQPVKITLAVSV